MDEPTAAALGARESERVMDVVRAGRLVAHRTAYPP